MSERLLDGIAKTAPKDRSDAVYYRAMDYVLYLRQDSAYVADRIDEWLTLLLDPQSGQPIGVKLKGFHNLYLEMQRMTKAAGADLRIPFRAFIAVAEAYACQIGDDIIEDRELGYQYDAYETARRIVGGLTVSATEIGYAKAA